VKGECSFQKRSHRKKKNPNLHDVREKGGSGFGGLALLLFLVGMESVEGQDIRSSSSSRRREQLSSPKKKKKRECLEEAERDFFSSRARMQIEREPTFFSKKKKGDGAGLPG